MKTSLALCLLILVLLVGIIHALLEEHQRLRIRIDHLYRHLTVLDDHAVQVIRPSLS